MATALMWKAYKIYEQTYGRILYCHPIHVDLHSKHFACENKKFPKFLLFYLGSLNVFLAGLCALADILMFFLNLQKLPVFYAFRFLIMVTASGLSSSLTTCCVGIHFNALVVYLNMLISFNKRLQFRRIFTPVTSRKQIDVTGYLMSFIVLTLFIVGILMGPGSIFRNSDPGYYLVLYCFPSYVKFTPTKILRYLHYQWYMLEVCRSIVCVILLTMLTFRIYIASLSTIIDFTCAEFNRRHTAIKIYAQLHIINQTGAQMLHRALTVLMLFGFLLCSLGVWLIVVGRKIFPLAFYILISIVMVIVFIVTICLIPVVINIYVCSKSLISRFWQKLETRKLIQDGRIYERKYWERLIRAQRPLCIFYGPGFFDKVTLPKFIYHVANNTVTMIIISAI